MSIDRNILKGCAQAGDPSTSRERDTLGPWRSVRVVIPPVRLRQVVLITNDLPAVTADLESSLGLDAGYADRGVELFGLENRVLAAGDCFIEVLTPVSTACTGARYLARRGGRDGGYMAIFQCDERDGIRRRVADVGVRVVWQADLEDISGTHLDPRDVPGAIVSLDWADPPESWHWAGPAWQGTQAGESATRRPGGITGLTVAVEDPPATATRWAQVLGHGVEQEGPVLWLRDAAQRLEFVSASRREDEGIVGWSLALAPVPGAPPALDRVIGGVRMIVEPLEGELHRQQQEGHRS